MVEKKVTMSTEQEIMESATKLLIQVRKNKRLTQDDVAQKMGVNRQTITRLENLEGAKIDLVTLAKAMEACGHQLVVSKKSKQLPSNAEIEVELSIIYSFEAGDIKEANKKLDKLKKWNYHVGEVRGRSLHEVAVALSLYFDGKPGPSVSRLNKMLMGLALSGFKKDADDYQFLYLDVIKNADKALALMVKAEDKK